MSKFRQGGKPQRPVIVTSRKKQKADRRVANAYGVQKQAAVKLAMDKAEELEQAIKASDDLHAIGAAAREAVWSEKRRSDAAMESFRRRHQDIEVTITPNAEDTISEPAEEVPDLLGEPVPYPVTTDWAAEDDGWMTPETGWKNAIFRLKNGSREVLNCPHKHKAPEAARACAIKAAKARNASNTRVMDGWTADARYPWTDGAVTALIDELRAD